MINRLDIVAVGVEHEGGVVAGVVGPRARRAGDRAAQPRALSQCVGVLADRGAVAGAMGPEGVRRLRGRRSRGVAGVRRHRAGRVRIRTAAVAGRPGRCR